MHPEVIRWIDEAVRKTNQKLSDFERISRHKIVPDLWGPDTGELSPTLKLKRQFLLDKYKNVVNQIYGMQKS